MAKNNQPKENGSLDLKKVYDEVSKGIADAVKEYPFLLNSQNKHKTRSAQTPSGKYTVIGVSIEEIDNDGKKTKWLAAICENEETHEVVKASMSAIFMSPTDIDRLSYTDVVLQFKESETSENKVSVEYRATAKSKPSNYNVPEFGTDDFTVFGAAVLKHPELVVGRRLEYFGKAVQKYISKKSYQNTVDNVWVERGQECASVVALWSQL